MIFFVVASHTMGSWWFMLFFSFHATFEKRTTSSLLHAHKTLTRWTVSGLLMFPNAPFCMLHTYFILVFVIFGSVFMSLRKVFCKKKGASFLHWSQWTVSILREIENQSSLKVLFWWVWVGIRTNFSKMGNGVLPPWCHTFGLFYWTSLNRLAAQTALTASSCCCYLYTQCFIIELAFRTGYQWHYVVECDDLISTRALWRKIALMLFPLSLLPHSNAHFVVIESTKGCIFTRTARYRLKYSSCLSWWWC